MAPRRLVAILIALLILSSIAAALAPVPPPGERTTTTSTPPPTTPEVTRPGGGKLVKASVNVPPAPGERERRREGGEPTREDRVADPPTRKERPPDRIELKAGDQLQLRVRSPQVVTLELRGTGEIVDAGPDSPGRLDVLVTRPGRYELAPIGAEGDPVAVVVASEPRSAQ